MDKFLDRLDNTLFAAEKIFLTIALTVMALTVFFDFVLRETMDAGIRWAKELSAFLMIWVGFVGASVATREKRHLVVGATEKLVSARVRKALAVVTQVIAIAFCIFLAKLGFEYVGQTREFAEHSDVLSLPLWIVQIIIPLSLLVMAARFLGHLIGILTGKEKLTAETHTVA
jgi:C4-dicarboxylate transporter DctQ subunit